ncbi:MAG: GNAT family N-acetyltransferase [bacterium]|nr:GNAT family N-acetyltransferase [bacterium]
MSDVSVRNAERDDLPRLYRLLRSKAEFDGAVEALSASQAELGEAIFRDPPPCVFVVAETEGDLVGFAANYPVFSTFAARPGLWMDDLFVEEDHRSRGIGRRLLVALAEEAARRRCCKLEWSLQKTNARGIAFYEREGAVVRELNRFAKLDEAGIQRLIGT